MIVMLLPATVRAAQQGDRVARARVVEVHGGLVFTLCRRYAPDPEDAYQDAWAHVLGRLHRYDPTRGASLRTWLALIVRNRLIDRKRTRKAAAEVLGDAPDAEGLSPEQQVARRQQVARVERALARLDPAQRDAVVLHYTAGVPLSDIARTQGVAVGTIKSRLHRARVRLASLMERA